MNIICDLKVPTPDGIFTARYSESGLCALSFPGRGSDKQETAARSAAIPPRVKAWHSVLTKALRAALAGKPVKHLPPLDLSRGTRFQQNVWREMARIACGKTSTYGELAQAVGKPGAARAVGGACGMNPVPVLLPCHRVLAANGGLGGFSGGLQWKTLLLRRERALA